jgi:hypothetical protein
MAALTASVAALVVAATWSAVWPSALDTPDVAWPRLLLRPEKVLPTVSPTWPVMLPTCGGGGGQQQHQPSLVQQPLAQLLYQQVELRHQSGMLLTCGCSNSHSLTNSQPACSNRQ